MTALSGWTARYVMVVACLGLLGCERIVQVDIPEGERRLVVEGRIERVKEAPGSDQSIRLTTTDAFFSNTTPPPAIGATVAVCDDQGGVFSFSESAPGVYVTSALMPTVGRTYTLDIEWEGEVYAAEAQMLSVPPIDSLYFIFEERSIVFDEEGFRATIDYSDPEGVPNFYLWEQLVNGVNLVPPDPGNAFNLVSEDEFYDGRSVIGFQPNDEIAIQPGQRATVRQIALSQRGHDFYFALFEQNAVGEGGTFSVPPANVRGNVENVTRPSSPALGFFEAAEVSVAEAIVP